MENNIILTPIPLDILLQSFREIIKEEMKIQQLNDLQEKLLSPKETCALFRPKICLPTLARWSEQGLIPRHDLGGRVWYKYSEILASLKRLKKYTVT